MAFLGSDGVPGIYGVPGICHHSWDLMAFLGSNGVPGI
jgi:hypothetical protein